MAKILVMDDEPFILLMIKKMLEKEGHEVDLALNGNDGLELFEKFKPDLVITDIIMPQKEGLEIILELRQKYPDLKIIAISGGGRVGPDGYLPGAKLFGADMVFQKPLIQKEFMLGVSVLLEEKGKMNLTI
jgi:CheY-like chemotaxis protein